MSEITYTPQESHWFPEIPLSRFRFGRSCRNITGCVYACACLSVSQPKTMTDTSGKRSTPAIPIPLVYCFTVKIWRQVESTFWLTCWHLWYLLTRDKPSQNRDDGRFFEPHCDSGVNSYFNQPGIIPKKLKQSVPPHTINPNVQAKFKYLAFTIEHRPPYSLNFGTWEKLRFSLGVSWILSLFSVWVPEVMRLLLWLIP